MNAVHLILAAAIVCVPLAPAASAISIYVVEAWLWMGYEGCGGTMPYYSWFAGASVDEVSLDSQGRPHVRMTYHYVDLQLYNHCPAGLVQVPAPQPSGASSSRQAEACMECPPSQLLP